MRVFLLISLLYCATITLAQRQNWTTEWKGFNERQLQGTFEIHFKANGPLGKDWIYGNYIDEDSLTRYVAYREGGRWKPLPFSGYYGGYATDLEMFGDTLFIAGAFGDMVLDKDSGLLPNTTILKYYLDSIWTAPSKILADGELSSKGDSLVVWASSYNNPSNQVIYDQFMTPDGGKTWQYPYGVVHPTETISAFGAVKRLEILDNGDILTLNSGGPSGNPYEGVARWDGQQWHGYGNGLYGGGYVAALDFDFYRGELYMGGTFSRIDTYFGDTVGYTPKNPGNAIVRWDGSQWQELGGGILEGGVYDIIVYDDVLYCQAYAGHWDYHLFGDAQIPFFAGWDGVQWCGTPLNYETAFPMSFGFANDTLFAAFGYPGRVNGDSIGFMAYFDGDYLHGPNAICSTPGLGEEERTIANDAVKVYPNPVNEMLYISLPLEVEEASFTLLALNGKVVEKGKLSPGENALEVVEKLNGVFLLKVATPRGEVVKKVVFEN